MAIAAYAVKHDGRQRREPDKSSVPARTTEIWSHRVARDGRIEPVDFLVLEVKHIDRGEQVGELLISRKWRRAPRVIRIVIVRPSRSLKERLRAN